MHLWGYRACREGDVLLVTGRMAGMAWMLVVVFVLVAVVIPGVLLFEAVQGGGNASAGLLVFFALFFGALGGVGLYAVLHKVATARVVRLCAKTGSIQIKTVYLCGADYEEYRLDKPWMLDVYWSSNRYGPDALLVGLLAADGKRVMLLNREVPQFLLGSKQLLAKMNEFVADSNCLH